MKKVSMRLWIGCGVCHALLTVSGWYALNALAQAAADGSGTAPSSLRALHELVQWLIFPIGTIALRAEPGIGGFDLVSFIVFTAVAMANSAAVTAAAGLTVAALRRRHISNTAP